MDACATRRWLPRTLVLIGLIAGSHVSGSPVHSPRPQRAAALEGPRRSSRLTETRADAAQVRDLIDLVNRRRRAIGCAPLIWDERLAKVAQHHSEAMARDGNFSHDDPNGDDPFDRMRDAGVVFRAAAENIAFGQRTGEEVYESWFRSPGHRANLENCVYTRHGVGLYRNRWTHVFARY